MDDLSKEGLEVMEAPRWRVELEPSRRVRPHLLCLRDEIPDEHCSAVMKICFICCFRASIVTNFFCLSLTLFSPALS